MPITLPTSPVTNQILSSSSDNYTWDGSKWVSTSITPTTSIGVVETGEAVLADGTYSFNGGSQTAPVFTAITFNIPSAGTWRVVYTIQGYTGGTSSCHAALYNNSNVLVPNSATRPIYTTSGVQCAQASQEVVISTTGPATYHLKCWSLVGASNIQSGDGAGWTKVRWQRLDSPTKVIGAVTTTSVADWINAGTLTIGATTTAPTKGTTTVDRVMYRNTGYKNYQVTYDYNQGFSGSAGSGQYLFSLPAGLNFSPTSHSFDQSLTPTTLTYGAIVPGVAGYLLHHNNNHHSSVIIPWDATRFRILALSGTVNVQNFMSNTYYPIGMNPGVSIKLDFTFIAA